MIVTSFRNVGDARTPQDVKRLRKNNIEMTRRMGQPIIHRHRFTLDELKAGSCTIEMPDYSITIPLQRCAACYDEEYSNARSDCPVCFGTTITSVETGDQFISASGRITATDTGVAAPVYRGFGPSILTWVVEPDVQDDWYKLNTQGVLIRQESARVFAPWLPAMEDMDIIINVTLEPDSYTIKSEDGRFELKSSNPLSIRGFGKIARGREFIVGQSFEMARLPPEHPYADVAIDADPITASTYRDAGRVRGVGTISGTETYEQWLGPTIDTVSVTGTTMTVTGADFGTQPTLRAYYAGGPIFDTWPFFLMTSFTDTEIVVEGYENSGADIIGSITQTVVERIEVTSTESGLTAVRYL